MMFLPERPYLPKSTLRDALLSPSRLLSSTDDTIAKVLGLLHLERVLVEAGGLDVERDWTNASGVTDQALMLVARVLLAKPWFVFLDRMSIALDVARAHDVLRLLEQFGITYVVIGKTGDPLGNFDAMPDLAADGSWTWRVLGK
jgi:vitamin B12/bleomycin/antimicrobial peptide transport system ATP-binding/permease protein